MFNLLGVTLKDCVFFFLMFFSEQMMQHSKIVTKTVVVLPQGPDHFIWGFKKLKYYYK